MTEPLVSDFNFLGVGEAAQQVLNGTYGLPDGVDKYAEMFLQHLVKNVEAKEGNGQATWLDTDTWKNRGPAE